MRKNKNQSGFAIMEVMIAAGLLGVIAYLFMHIGEQVINMESRMKDMMDMSDLVSRTRIHLSDSQACFRTFQPLFKKLKTNEKLTFPITLEKVIGKYGNPLLEVGKSYGRLKVESIQVTFDPASIPKKNFENEIGFINLRYRIKSSAKGAMPKSGHITLSAIIHNPFTAPAPYMSACFSETSILVQEVSNEVMSRMCASIGSSYNADTKTCGQLGANSNSSSSLATDKIDFNKMQLMQEKAMKIMEELIKNSNYEEEL